MVDKGKYELVGLISVNSNRNELEHTVEVDEDVILNRYIFNNPKAARR